MASPAPFIKQEPREEEESFFSSSTSTIQNKVSYASLNTSIGSYEDRIFIRSQPHSIMGHGLESLVSANHKRSREPFDHDTNIEIKQENMRPRKKLATERYQIVAPTLRDDYPNSGWDEDTPSPEPEEEHQPSYASDADAHQYQSPQLGSASSDININAGLENNSVPTSYQGHHNSAPSFGDEYIPFDTAAEPEGDEDSGFFEGDPRAAPQRPTAYGNASSLTPLHEASFGSTPVGYLVSATAGADEDLTEDRSRNAEQTEFTSDGQCPVKVEDYSYFGNGTFVGEYKADNDYLSNYARYSDRQAESLGPEYDQENIDPAAGFGHAFGYGPEPPHVTIPAPESSRKRSLSQYEDEYVLEVETSPGVRRKLNGLFDPSRDTFHPLPSFPPRLRYNNRNIPFPRASSSYARSVRSDHDDEELRRAAQSIKSAYNPGWPNDYPEQRHNEHTTPPRDQSHDGPNNHYTPNTGRHHSQTRKAFPYPPNVYGAGFHRRELRYASPDAIHAHYIGTQPSRSRESSVDVLEENMNDIEHFERRTQKALEELSTTESSIGKLHEEARNVHDAVRLSTILKEHWKVEARKVENAVREKKVEEGVLRGFVGKVEKAWELLAQAEEISKELDGDEELAGFGVVQEDEQEQQSQAMPMAYGFQGRDGYIANQWNWLEREGGY